MLISYNELLDLRDKGVIQTRDRATGELKPVEISDINGTSIDVYLDHTIKVERRPSLGEHIVSLKHKDRLTMTPVDIAEGFYDLKPGEFILASTVEVFNLPADISIEFKLNSSGARIGLENALATWGDPHWNGSTLTLELKNFSQYHTIRLHDGVRIGQIIFHRSEPVPVDKGYAVRGRYNGDVGVQEVKNVEIAEPQVEAKPAKKGAKNG